MERFVRLVVAGGTALVAALWAAQFAVPQSATWLLAVALAAAGGASILAGIWLELDADVRTFK